MTKRAYLYGGTALAVTLSLCAFQSRAAAAAGPGGATNAAAESTISELIVTAEKRSERLQDVPVAISAFSAEQRTLVGIQSVQDLTNFTPGFHFQAAADRPYLRGVGRNTDNLAVASAVATYYDGVYYGANATILLQHSDLFVDTIEVDRGPQNSLHGANADGGTINYISKRPTKEFYAEGRAGVANNQRYWGEAVVSGPVTEWLRFRLGGNYTTERGGFFNNLGSAKDAGGNLPQETAGQSQYFEGQLDANIGKLDAWAKASSGTFTADYHQVARIGNFPDNYQANGSFSPNTFFGLCGLPGVAASPGPGPQAGEGAGEIRRHAATCCRSGQQVDVALDDFALELRRVARRPQLRAVHDAVAQRAAIVGRAAFDRARNADELDVEALG